MKDKINHLYFFILWGILLKWFFFTEWENDQSFTDRLENIPSRQEDLKTKYAGVWKKLRWIIPTGTT